MVRTRTPIQPPRFPKLRDAVALDHTGTSASGLATSVIGSVAWVSVADCWARFVPEIPKARDSVTLRTFVRPATRTRPVSSRDPSGERLGPRLNDPRLRQACGCNNPATSPVMQSPRFPQPARNHHRRRFVCGRRRHSITPPPPKPRHADGEHDYMAVAQAREITTFAFDASKPAHVKVGADAGGLRCEP